MTGTNIEKVKRTPVGFIPTDWEVTTIGDEFDVSAGGDWDAVNSSKVRDRDHPYPVFANALSRDAVQGYCRYFTIPGESLTITGRGDVGKAAYRPHPFVPIVRLLALVPRRGSSARFFTDYINSRIKFSLESTGVPQLTAPQVRPYLIARPSNAEQRVIASALADANDLLAALERLIAKKQAIKQGMMQQLLTGRARLPNFAGEWGRAQLSNVGTIVTGSTPPTSDRSNYGRDHMFVSPADLGRSKYVTTTDKMLSKIGFARTRRIPAGSTLFVCIGSTIGKVGLTAEDLATNQQINSIIPNDSVDPEYLYYAANTLSSVVREQAGEQAVPLVNKSQFSAFEILVPPFPEQRAIAEVLSDADTEIAQLRAKLDKATTVKTGMMQELLNGHTRLSVEEAAV